MHDDCTSTNVLDLPLFPALIAQKPEQVQFASPTIFDHFGSNSTCFRCLSTFELYFQLFYTDFAISYVKTLRFTVIRRQKRHHIYTSLCCFVRISPSFELTPFILQVSEQPRETLTYSQKSFVFSLKLFVNLLCFIIISNIIKNIQHLLFLSLGKIY